MSEFELNPIFLKVSKSMGGIVFYEKDGKIFSRMKGKRKVPFSEAQIDVNNTFLRISSYWSSMQGIIQDSWLGYGLKKKANGYNLFMKENFEKERTGDLIAFSKQLGEIDPPVISATPGNPGEIIVTYEISPAEQDRQLHLFIKIRKDGLSAGDLTRYSINREASSPYTLSGLEPASEYYIYALLTDWEYKTATQVSSSTGIIARTGGGNLN